MRVCVRVCECVHVCVCTCVPSPQGLSSLVKELMAATRVIQSSSNESSSLVSGKAKYKQTKATT